MASNISSMINSKLRLTGMVSGLDTDSIVKQLLAADQAKVNKVKQAKTLTEWKRDNYRDITNALRSFQDEFFNVTNSASNMRSLNTYSIYNSVSSDSAVATATGNSDVRATKHTIEVISLAKAASGTSTGAATKSLNGNTVNGFNIDGYNRNIVINYNGTSKQISLPSGSYTDAASVLGNGSDGKLKDLIQQAFGGKVTVSETGGKLQFNTANTTDTISISTNYAAGDNMLNTLGVTSNGVGSALNFSSPMQILKGMKFEITTIESGVPTTSVIQWDTNKTYNDINELTADLQSRIDSSLGSGKITVTSTDGKLGFASGSGVDSFSLSNTDIAKDLGFQSGVSNKLNLGDTIEQISSKLAGGAIAFGTDGTFTLTINNTDIKLNKTDTLSNLISKINNSAAGVTMTYSSYSDTFALTANNTGAGTISINDNGSNFFAGTKLTSITAGQDASFKLDGLAGSRSNNTFSVDGVTYTLAAQGTTNITLTQNTDQIFDKIKSFVDKYNELIGKINGELSEDYNRSYTPLTDEQKSSMSEDQITKWEEKAKTGLLKNDSILNNIVSSMRKALSDSIQDIPGGLFSIGITTGSYLEKGKLIIDQEKLKTAIKNNPDSVMNIFAKESSISYTDTTNGGASKAERYKQNGIVNRLYDILRDNIRTTRDSDGKKGALLEKAGLVGDLSEYTNLMNKDMDSKDKMITQLVDKLYEKEDAYYKKYAALEKALSSMNSQSSWLASQMGGGQQ